MARMGMDVDAVERTGRALQAQAVQLGDLVGRLDRLVHQLPAVWEGDDARRFVQEWWPEHKTALAGSREAVHGLGQSALNNASEQREASGGDGGGSATAVAPAGPTDTTGHHAPQQTAASGHDGPQDVSAGSIVDHARSEVGTSRPTGWNQEGECVKSVQRWVKLAGGTFVGGGPVAGYEKSGAIQVSLADARPGDVIQYTSLTHPNSWDQGVHTVLVAGTNANGSLDIIQSNAPAGSGKVTEVSSWTPKPPAGFEARVWRFGHQ